jgi:hypothetical protein
VLLSRAFPELARDALAQLSVGHRDAMLFALRDSIFGPDLIGYAACPRCSLQLELAITSAELHVRRHEEPVGVESQVSLGEFAARFRLPDSRDLTAAAASERVADAHRILLRRCVIESTHGGERIDPVTLPSEVTEALAARMLACDPQAEIVLRLTCPGCACEWSALLDMGEFLWAELSAYAGRLLHEVDTLARAYGWGETEILTMSGRRREAYLALAST